MYLQGNLQTLFDALYNLGVIEPLLKKNWRELMKQRKRDSDDWNEVIAIANRCQNNPRQLIYYLEKFDQGRLNLLAMEVAREYAEFHARTNLQ